MDYRGAHPWPDPGRHSHRGQDREGHPRLQQTDPNYTQPKPREHDRNRGYPETFHRMSVRPEPSHYNPQHGYGRPDYQRPPSRYDYAPPPNWDYRDGYGYYDYYRGQQGHVQWGPPDSWRADQYYESSHKPELPRSHYPDEYRYDQRKENSQHFVPDYVDNPSRDTEDVSSFYLGTLESSKNSGLSSSSCELSQYMNGAEHADLQHVEHVHQVSAPLKYSIPHAVVSFGPAGQLIRVSPALSMQGNASRLEIHSLEVILSETQEQREMRNFPGPLTREDLHKVDAIEFAQQRAEACRRDEALLDGSSAALLWNLLILLCRQNGQIVGSDIAELLMQSSRADRGLECNAPTLIDFNEDAATEAPPPQKGDDLLTGNTSSFSSEGSDQVLRSYTRLLLAGRKKDALEEAMTGGLWGHAFFLASKMGSRPYTTVLNRFTDQLTASDPLLTLFQLLSGRIPAVATCCGNEKWGDWKPHLAVMLSNEAGDPSVRQKAIATMGDTLASRGLVHAAHVCYLTAGTPFGVFTSRAERLVLLGSSHRQSFRRFATNASIQCTELFEYCQTLLDKSSSIPCFQVYKFLYASRLLGCGLPSQAFHYCELVGRAVLRQTEPSLVLTGELIKLSDRLMFSEGQFGDSRSETLPEPDWLRLLRTRYHSLLTGSYDPTETHLPHPVAGVWTHDEDATERSESDLNEGNFDVQSPEPEFLYYHNAEPSESLLHQSDGITADVTAPPWDAADWRRASPPCVPALVVCPPPAPTAAASDGYLSTDSAGVNDVGSHRPESNVPSAPQGMEGSAATGTISPSVAGVDTSQHFQSQQVVSQGFEPSNQTADDPKQGEKTGWFSSWFKSKPKEVQKDASEPQTEHIPTPAFSAPPPPPPAAAAAAGPPSTLPPQASSGGINPFSRKAGLQLG